MTERVQDHAPYGAGHGIPDRQGSGDDGRGEHQPDDDQHRLGAPSRDVPNGELHQDAIAKGHRDYREACDRKDDDERDGESRHRYAKKVFQSPA